mmetsp:Transcript_776/g.1723  ORF Transcript_776/g.1723 Transcript_776/m.1723 type:complete len:216 (-) Transcript_776:380-1027(-)
MSSIFFWKSLRMSSICLRMSSDFFFASFRTSLSVVGIFSLSRSLSFSLSLSAISFFVFCSSKCFLSCFGGSNSFLGFGASSSSSSSFLDRFLSLSSSRLLLRLESSSLADSFSLHPSLVLDSLASFFPRPPFSLRSSGGSSLSAGFSDGITPRPVLVIVKVGSMGPSCGMFHSECGGLSASAPFTGGWNAQTWSPPTAGPNHHPLSSGPSRSSQK